MAGKKNNELFEMDDGDTSEVAGGLNDGPEFDESTEEEIEFIDHVELDDEPEPEIEPEAAEELEPESEPEPETDPEVDPEKEPEPKPEPEIDPAEKRFADMVGMMAKKDEQLQTLVAQVKALTEKVIKPKAEPEPEPIEAPQPPDADEMEWDEYIEARFKYQEDIKEFKAEAKRREDDQVKSVTEKKQVETLTKIKTLHAQDYAEQAEDLPVLKNPEQGGSESVRAKWAEIYNNPANGYNKRIDGVFRATQALKKLAKANNINLLTFGQEPAKTEPAKPAVDPDKLASDEAARQKRLATGSMQGGGKTSTGTKAAPDAGCVEAAERMGVSIEAYMDSYNKTMKALGGK